MVAVDGVRAPTGARLRRLVRRWLVVASLALGGWLLGALFAASPAAAAGPTPENEPWGATSPTPGVASAPETGTDAGLPVYPAVEPAAETPGEALTAPTPGDGLLGGLLDGLDGTLSTVTQSVLGVLADSTPAPPPWTPPFPTAPGTPVPGMPLPEPLPVLPPLPEPAPGPAASQPDTAPVPATEPSAEPRPGTAPGSRPAPGTTPGAVREHVAPVAALTWLPASREDQAARTAPGKTAGKATDTDQHAEETPGPAPLPTKAPGAPGSGSTASTGHDTSSGARGSLGVLSAQSPLPPRTAGHSTGGHAAETAGRIAGLPVTSPD